MEEEYLRITIEAEDFPAASRFLVREIPVHRVGPQKEVFVFDVQLDMQLVILLPIDFLKAGNHAEKTSLETLVFVRSRERRKMRSAVQFYSMIKQFGGREDIFKPSFRASSPQVIQRIGDFFRSTIDLSGIVMSHFIDDEISDEVDLFKFRFRFECEEFIRKSRSKGIRKAYRKSVDLSFPDLPPNHEKNRTRERLSVRLDHTILAMISDLKQDGESRDAFISETIHKSLAEGVHHVRSDLSLSGNTKPVKLRLEPDLISAVSHQAAQLSITKTRWISFAVYARHQAWLTANFSAVGPDEAPEP